MVGRALGATLRSRTKLISPLPDGRRSHGNRLVDLHRSGDHTERRGRLRHHLQRCFRILVGTHSLAL